MRNTPNLKLFQGLLVIVTTLLAGDGFSDEPDIETFFRAGGHSVKIPKTKSEDIKAYDDIIREVLKKPATSTTQKTNKRKLLQGLVINHPARKGGEGALKAYCSAGPSPAPHREGAVRDPTLFGATLSSIKDILGKLAGHSDFTCVPEKSRGALASFQRQLEDHFKTRKLISPEVKAEQESFLLGHFYFANCISIEGLRKTFDQAEIDFIVNLSRLAFNRHHYPEALSADERLLHRTVIDRSAMAREVQAPPPVQVHVHLNVAGSHCTNSGGGTFSDLQQSEQYLLAVRQYEEAKARLASFGVGGGGMPAVYPNMCPHHHGCQMQVPAPGPSPWLLVNTQTGQQVPYDPSQPPPVLPAHPPGAHATADTTAAPAAPATPTGPAPGPVVVEPSSSASSAVASRARPTGSSSSGVSSASSAVVDIAVTSPGGAAPGIVDAKIHQAWGDKLPVTKKPQVLSPHRTPLPVTPQNDFGESVLHANFQLIPIYSLGGMGSFGAMGGMLGGLH